MTGAVQGWALFGMHRTGTRRYKTRPPANCRSARAAWDEHSLTGPVVWLQLLDGYWGAMRVNGNIDEIENRYALDAYRPTSPFSGEASR